MKRLKYYFYCSLLILFSMAFSSGIGFLFKLLIEQTAGAAPRLILFPYGFGIMGFIVAVQFIRRL